MNMTIFFSLSTFLDMEGKDSKLNNLVFSLTSNDKRILFGRFENDDRS